MKLFKVEAVNEVDWGEYDAVVVRAESEDDAIAFVNEAIPLFPGWEPEERYRGLSGRDLEVSELRSEGLRGEILASFNAD